VRKIIRSIHLRRGAKRLTHGGSDNCPHPKYAHEERIPTCQYVSQKNQRKGAPLSGSYGALDEVRGVVCHLEATNN
jgi:hypothetical protein